MEVKRRNAQKGKTIVQGNQEKQIRLQRATIAESAF